MRGSIVSLLASFLILGCVVSGEPPAEPTYRDAVRVRLEAWLALLDTAAFSHYQFRSTRLALLVDDLLDDVTQANGACRWEDLPGALVGAWSSLGESHRDASTQQVLERLLFLQAFELLPELEARALQERVRLALESARPHDLDPDFKTIGRNLVAGLELDSLRELERLSPALPGATRTAPTWVLAHRGGQGAYPENSLAGLQASLRLADGIECDLRSGADGEVWVLHDDDLERLTGQPMLVSRLATEQILRLRLRDPFSHGRPSRHQPLRVTQLLQTIDESAWVWLELKSDGGELLPDRLGDILASLESTDRIIVASLDRRMLDPLRRRFPDLTIAFEFTELGGVDLGWLLQAPDRERLILSADHFAARRPDLVAAAKQAGLRTSSFILNRHDSIRVALDHGIDFIQTDYPARVRLLGHLAAPGT